MQSTFWKMSILLAMTALLCTSAAFSEAKTHYRETFHSKSVGPNNFGLLRVYASHKHGRHPLHQQAAQPCGATAEIENH